MERGEPGVAAKRLKVQKEQLTKMVRLYREGLPVPSGLEGRGQYDSQKDLYREGLRDVGRT